MASPAAAADAEGGYSSDFESDYEEEFESDGGDQVEGPPASCCTPAAQDEDEQQEAGACTSSSSNRQVDVHAWPSLSTSLRTGSSRHLQHAGAPAFGRALFAPSGDSGAPAPRGSDAPGARITLQPPPPPLSDAQRPRAAKALQRSRQLQQQLKLGLSAQLELLALPPMAPYQQFCQGVGVYAGKAAAASCQTRQPGQDVQDAPAQTEEVETQPASCQAPDDLHASTAVRATAAKPTGRALMSDPDPALAGFLDWAAPQVMFELDRAAAALAAEGSVVALAAGLRFLLPSAALPAAAGAGGGKAAGPPLITGELLLCSATGVLAGRRVVGIAAPAMPAAAAAAASAISAAAAAAGGVSSHLLLTCCAPVQMPSAAAALKAHGAAGLGCLCVWDLQQASGQVPGPAGSSGASAQGTQGLLQLLVSEGQPSCCCWGVGGGSCVVFAGMEEGGICCWDLSEPDSAHPALEPAAPSLGPLNQPEAPCAGQHILPARRPAYTTAARIITAAGDSTEASADRAGSSSSSGWLEVGGVAAVACLPPSSGSSAQGAAAAAGAACSWGPACQLLAATSTGCVSLSSVMLGGAGSDAAVGDLGMRTGSRVWLVRLCEWMPLGLDLVKPPHMRSTAQLALPTARGVGSGSSSSICHGMQPLQVACMQVLPGADKQLLVGAAAGRVLKGACLGNTAPPHEYVATEWKPGMPCGSGSSSSSSHRGMADTAAVTDIGARNYLPGVLGAVLGLTVCPACPEAWLAGLSCGRVALFGQLRSRPVLLWQHPHGAAVLAVRWLPALPCAFVTLCAAGCRGAGGSTGSLLAFNLAVSTKQPVAGVQLLAQHGEAQEGASSSASATPCCMEVLVSSSRGTSAYNAAVASSFASGGQPAGDSSSRWADVTGVSDLAPASTSCVSVAVGFDDGTSCLYQLGPGWSGAGDPSSFGRQIQCLQQLLAG